jgi:hypothetical protein
VNFSSQLCHNHQIQPKIVTDPKMASKTTVEPYDSFALASSQSFGFFDDIPEERWRMHQQRFFEYSRHEHPDNPLRFNPLIG